MALYTSVTYGQDRCGTVEYTQKLKTQQTLFEEPDVFEKWIKLKQQEKARQSGTQRNKATYQIPVVVHVVHNGESVGSGKNISDAQILSQLAVLNKDYKRLNVDVGNTPAEFLPVAGIFDIEFVLAKQTPEGLATNGIVRVQGTKTSWTMNDNYTLKALSYWPAEDYLNIWVCNLTDFLGYSQFPVSGLPGLENSSTNRLTDGVVIAFNVFGSSDDGAFNLLASYNKGRTTTHEVGHFFGLRHIWGDDNGVCSGTDYVDDTPNQGGSTSGCPAHPRVTCTSVTSMFQNYLDYTDDNCMNLFTQGQVSRMVTVVENSPRRATLLTSHGLLNPLPVANDLGIKTIEAPLSGACSAPFAPAIEIRNYGSNTVSAARIRVKKDGVTTETKDVLFNPVISMLGSATINFAPISFPSGNHNVSFEILLTNGVADGNTLNNMADQDVLVPQDITIPFSENFNVVPASWSILNPDQFLTWTLVTAPVSGSNKAMKMEFYNYEDHTGEIDILLTPVFDLTAEPAALLKFDVAYARYQSSNDGLKVVLLSGCNADISQGIVVYEKSGQSLATTTSSTAEFTPNGPDQWRKDAVDLSAYIGQPNLQLAFVGLNDWGNNLYLDNISLTTTPVDNMALMSIIAPGPVLCQGIINPILRIQNTGTLLKTFSVNTIVNGQATTQTLVGLSLPGNAMMDVTLNTINLQDGQNEISFELTNPNGAADFEPEDNAMALTVILNNATDNLPLRQDFEGVYEPQWTHTNPGDGMDWEEINLGKNTALYFNAFANTLHGDEAWLVSPVVDFSTVEGASLSFDISYAFHQNTSDMLRVLASTDCGVSYQDTLAVISGKALSNGIVTDVSWKPTQASDWSNRSIALTSLIGTQDVRIAFVFTNDNGNNFYIDNLEFFVSDDPLKIAEPFSVYPNPVAQNNASITFNLPEKGPVTLIVTDSMGKVIIHEDRSDILNQTFALNLPGTAPGVYGIRIIAGKKIYFQKLLVLR